MLAFTGMEEEMEVRNYELDDEHLKKGRRLVKVAKN
jgi:hypothetical protein